jgi:hypothetical protein
MLLKVHIFPLSKINLKNHALPGNTINFYNSSQNCFSRFFQVFFDMANIISQRMVVPTELLGWARKDVKPDQKRRSEKFGRIILR